MTPIHESEKYKVIRITAAIHPDGDMYVKVGKTFYYVGCIEITDPEIVNVPQESYTKLKKFLKRKAK